ncbi:AraC family transcriptional regulator [Paenibacillus sp. Y412MC10]|uniref:AraC family transcriptional regulator n=1 Tax=Geobacillus sp. (strain Y412MC10) TaxID=481743 RepID=UPI0011AB3A5C|nr:AraC family transcriptional regulator [Paenibacillus sp. Y412MC10]
MKHYTKHMLISPLDRTLPIFVETIGWNEWQEEFIRPVGYHCYHWLHTTHGEGQFEYSGKTINLTPNRGILLKPGTPHRYRTISHPWSTYYVTFNGDLAPLIISSLGLATSTLISWEMDSPLSTLHKTSHELADQEFDLNGMLGSVFIYRFLMDLKRYGEIDNQRSISQYAARLTPIFQYLNENYSNPAIGLAQLAELAGVSSQRLNYIFRKATGMSPYQYIIRIRIQKAKELLINKDRLTVKQIAAMVGFTDDSHFVSTFRKIATVTPETYRNIN